MTKRIRDPDVRILVGLAATLEPDYVVADDPWKESPFGWIRNRPSSRQRGAIGEKLVAGWCAAKGLDVIRSRSSQADRIVNGHRIEIKFSTPWENGAYKFQQIRHQDYDYALCLGIAPFDAHCWVFPKAVLYEVEHMTGQHTGAAATETSWFSVNPQSPPGWTAPYGGRLSQAYAYLRSLGRGPY
jgi:hypothetical protein